MAEFEGLHLLTELIDAGWRNMGLIRPDGRHISIWYRGDDWYYNDQWEPPTEEIRFARP